MPRNRRSFETGRIYHLVPVGNDRRPVFEDDAEKQELLRRGAQVMPRHEIDVLGYVLMRTHAHFLVVVRGPGEALSAAMQLLLGGFSRWRNRRCESTGHN